VLHRRRQRTRRGVLTLAAALCLSAVALPSSAQAYEQWYCNVVVSPLTSCTSSGLHSWYFNSATTGYSGATVCAYMWNAHNGVVRGGSFPCDYQYVEQWFNRTSDLWYNARVYNGTTQFSIIIVGHALA
jgi:hypothetical protein